MVRRDITQSIIFSKKKWTKLQAQKWLLEHGYKATSVRLTPNFFRFQQSPAVMGKYAVKTLYDKGKPIDLVIHFKNENK